MSQGTQAQARKAKAPAKRPAGSGTPQRRKPAANRRSSGIRKARMTISRIDPWSALKISFLLSIGLGVMIVIATVILWNVLDAMHVFASIEELLNTLGSEAFLELLQYLEFGRVVSFATIIAVVDIVLFTLLGVLFALLYNAIALLVGGLHITVTDE